MNDTEKLERCNAAANEAEALNRGCCRVLSRRNVELCQDCSFSVVVRPRYLQSKGAI